MLKSLIVAVSALLLLALPVAALADPVQWTLNGVTFNDTGTASGSFVYDADTDTYSNVSITTTAGTVRATGAVYNAASTAITSNATVLYLETAGGAVAGQPFMRLTTAAKTNVGGTLTVTVQPAEGTCSNTPCNFTMAPIRDISAGTITGVPVPMAVPTLSEWAMILFGLMLAGGAALYIQRQQLIA